MVCSVNFTINKQGKLVTKVKWTKNTKILAKFRKFLTNLQAGNHNLDICEAIIKFGNDNFDNKNARRLLKPLVPQDTSGDEPLIFPQELGEAIDEQG